MRARTKIRVAGIPYQVPSRELLPERLHAVLSTIYLVFNEGYAATEGEALLRAELCDEAIRLGRWLRSALPKEAEVAGVLALMLFHHARRDSRTDARGELVLLEEQDRSRWDRPAIDEATRLLDGALGQGPGGPYAIQAAIAALHATAPSAAQTDWRQIALLYDALWRVLETPTVGLNRAVAIGMGWGASAGLEALLRLPEAEFAHTHLYAAARADLLRRAGNEVDAAEWYARALTQVKNAVERRYLERRLAALGRASARPLR